ncbi:MAG: helix-turn-helix domain-containing protein [Acidobacteria bacterium]|nr:MAG: helix-turn-helix domain-containing protein [Acidobacteriota bacterium]
MQLTVRDVAQLLAVSEKTVYRWVGQRKLPAYRVNEQLRFNRAELLEWASANKAQVSPELFAEPESVATPAPSLAQALREGGIHYRVGGDDTQGVLRSVVELMRLPEEVDRGFLLQVLLAREALQSTGIGDGVAIPHPRSPIVLHISRPSVTLCFLEKPVEFGALDGRPVHALFTLVSPTARAHLQLLSRVAYGLRDEAFRVLIARVAARDEILAAAARVDGDVAAHAAAAPAAEV